MAKRQPKFTRMFSGKKFVLLDENLSYGNARVLRNQVRSRGKKARITSFSGRFNLYGRK